LAVLAIFVFFTNAIKVDTKNIGKPDEKKVAKPDEKKVAKTDAKKVAKLISNYSGCPKGYIHHKCNTENDARRLTKVSKFCAMKRVGKCSKRNRCCIKSKKCKGKVCKERKVKCFWQGKRVKAKCYKEKCSFKSYGECHKRQQCCNMKGKYCRWSGKKVSTGHCKVDRICASRRVGKCHLRKRCCDLNGKKCAWVGKPYKTGSCGKSICSMRTVGKCSLRKRCCKQIKTKKKE